MSTEATDTLTIAEPEHGVESACYSGGYGEPYYQPFIGCSCGWGLRAESWAEVGEAFDAHLKESSR